MKQVRDPATMGRRAARLVTEGMVTTLAGTDLALEARSICVHGDAPNAPEVARAVRAALEEAGVELSPLRELV